MSAALEDANYEGQDNTSTPSKPNKNYNSQNCCHCRVERSKSEGKHQTDEHLFSGLQEVIFF